MHFIHTITFPPHRCYRQPAPALGSGRGVAQLERRVNCSCACAKDCRDDCILAFGLAAVAAVWYQLLQHGQMQVCLEQHP